MKSTRSLRPPWPIQSVQEWVLLCAFGVRDKAVEEIFRSRVPAMLKRWPPYEESESTRHRTPRLIDEGCSVHFAGTIDLEDLMDIERAIKEGCEKVNPDEW